MYSSVNSCNESESGTVLDCNNNVYAHTYVRTYVEILRQSSLQWHIGQPVQSIALGLSNTL